MKSMKDMKKVMKASPFVLFLFFMMNYWRVRMTNGVRLGLWVDRGSASSASFAFIFRRSECRCGSTSEQTLTYNQASRQTFTPRILCACPTPIPLPPELDRTTPVGSRSG